MNYSKQREVIYNYLCNTKQHPTAEVVYAHAKTLLPSISKGTVYRNLCGLVESGQVLQLDDKTGTHRFDADKSLHAHFNCVLCGAFEDVIMPELQKIAKQYESLSKNKIVSNQIIFDGVCAKCGKKLTKEEWQNKP